ncbi:MAG: peroxiredoxin Q/BCP [Acidimicrobiales bacterium]|jgi:thioredoxin-dependent peroxiredoxin
MTVILGPGDRAPKFTLLDQHGHKLALASLAGSPVLLYFFPKANTPGCTTQSELLRDVVPQIGEAKVLGISPDPVAKQLKFDEKFDLGFPLLSDPEHKVAVKYGVWGEKKLYGKVYMGIVRSAFLIDGGGKISAAFYKVSPKNTPIKLLGALEAST